MDQMFTSHFRDNNSCYLPENESTNQEQNINRIYIDTNDKRFKDAVTIAKNTFVKRTRTLYNWLYPDVSRKEINHMVMQTWEKLPQKERRKEILQVLNEKNQESNAQVNPQVFDLFQEHIATDPFKNSKIKNFSSIQPKVAKVEPVLTARTVVMPITVLPPATVANNTTSVSVNNNNSLKRTRLSNEENGKYFNLENCKKVKRELIKGECECSPTINCDDFGNVEEVFEEFNNDPELSNEFREFVFNEQQLLQL